MNYKIVALPFFEKQLKRLVKKYPSLRAEYVSLLKQLNEHPQSGTSIGNHCYKIRLAITSKGKGKSGGARVITYLQVVNSTVYLVSIYDKSEQSNISDSDISDIIKNSSSSL